MFPSGGIVMKIDQLLVSSAMLSALLDKKGQDNLELLKPFVVMALADVTTLDEIVSKSKVLKILDETYGFQAMPPAVLDKVLMRLEDGGEAVVEQCSSATTKERQFRYKVEPSEQIRLFQSRMQQAEHDTERVLDALMVWLGKNIKKDAVPRPQVKEALGTFFETNGFDIFFEPEELRNATAKDTDAINYQIGRFVLNAQDNDHDLFEKIVSIAQGVMVTSTIYVNTSPETKFATRQGFSKLRNVNVFLDTALLLCVLNWKTEESKQAADALLALLQNNGASIYVFEQHYVEVSEILRNSQMSRTNPLPLEGLEGTAYSKLEIEAIIRGLEGDLNRLGINIYRGNRYIDSDGQLLKNGDAYIDSKGLGEHLRDKFLSYQKHSAMLNNDVDAISSVMAMRAGVTYQTIESCPAIFVTTNYRLVRESNYFLRYSVSSPYIAPLMSDTDIATVLWLKYGMQARSDIPRLKLVEYARAAVQPSTSVMNAFNDIAARLVANGILTEDEAANMRYDAYAKTEMTRLCNGDGNALTDEHITDVRDRLKDRYSQEERERADEAIALAEDSAKQVEALAHRAKEGAIHQARLQSKSLDATKQKIKTHIHELRKLAEERAEKQATFWSTWCYRVLVLLVGGVMLGCAIITMITGIKGSINVVGTVALAISALSAFLLFSPGLSWAKKVREWVRRCLYSRFEAKEKEKCESEIEKLQSFLP